MTTSTSLRVASSQTTARRGIPVHCPEDEYAMFVAALPVTDRWRRKHAQFHLRFRRAYPELGTWFAQPLRDRLGWRNGEEQNRRCPPEPGFDATAAWTNFNARHYLTYLALTGRLRMDWGWLLGIGVLKPFLVADQLGLPLRDQSERLRERLIALGHVRDDEGFRVPWGLIRLVLHRGDPDPHMITSGDVEEMRHAIRHCERIPGLLEVVGEERYRGLKSAWGTNSFRTGLALFHTGVTDLPPTREGFVPPPRLSCKPRIDAVFERFLAERALVLRPESMTSVRGGLRRFGLCVRSRPRAAGFALRTPRTELGRATPDRTKPHPQQPKLSR